MTEVAAIIQYECLTLLARSAVRDRQKAREFARCQPKTNAGLLKIQGPWTGQDADPVDFKGPAAIPMPTTIGKAEDFTPIFGFLVQNESFATAGRDDTQPGDFEPNFEFLKERNDSLGRYQC
jgi:hypothetical protein